MKLRIAASTSTAYFISRTDQTERMQPVVLTDQESEVRAAGPRCAVGKNAIANCVGNPGFRIGE